MSIKILFKRTLIMCSIIPLLIVSLLAYGLNTNRLLSVQGTTLKHISNTNSKGIKSLIDNQITELSLLAVQANIRNLLLINPTLDENKLQYIEYSSRYTTELLESRIALNEAMIDISVYTKSKQVIATSNPEKLWMSNQENETLRYLETQKKAVTSHSGLQVRTSDTGLTTYYLEFGVPIFHEKSTTEVIGYIISEVDVLYLKDYIDSLAQNGNRVSYIVDKQGQFVCHNNISYIGTFNSSEKMNTILQTYHNDTHLDSSHSTDYYEEKEVLYAYTVIPSLEWVLIVQENISDTISLANINLMLVLLATILSIVVLILVSTYLSERYSKPILLLRDAMSVASSGNLDIQIDIKPYEEFEDLSISFNKMIESTKKNYDDLSKLHEELLSRELELEDKFKRIEYLAYHDNLTDLPNKLHFIETVSKKYSSPLSQDRLFSLFMIDIDNFKNINELFGYEYGDKVIKEVSYRLKQVLDEGNILAKIGGDSFVLYNDTIKMTEDILEYANTLHTLFNKPFCLQGEAHFITISIGISNSNARTLDINTLMRQADIAINQSKLNGRNKTTVFTPSMESELIRKTNITSILRDAIANQELYVNYQPQLNLDSNQIIGFEALMRLNSKKMGFIPPDQFIPIAEETGLIIPLGEWILQESCKFCSRINETHNHSYTVAVNVSPIQLSHPNFLSLVKEVLQDTKIEPRNLELEITESTFISSLEYSKSILEELLKLGVRISLDDFGTGYSSLNHLTNMPIKTLKIDKSFIDNITLNEKDASVARTIIELAHQIQVVVVAEGVETKEQLKLLKETNCDIVQGYVFSRPLSKEALRDLLHGDEI